MAGSWDHITTSSGKFQGTWLIENLGDAYEALEECYGMVVYLADQLAGFPGVGDRKAARNGAIDEAERNYKEGLRIGGVAKRTYFGE
jgi:hypothetical protein